jgi:acylphosphatase
VSEPVGRKVQIYGRVQGVFFRQWAINQARELGVAGWIRNRPDGSVEAHVAGPEGGVLQMVDRLREGPSNARVDDFMVEHTEPEPIEGFSVRI